MVTRSILLGTTAIAALGLAACNSSNDPAGVASAAEIGPFGYVVGEPVGVKSATRGGDGVVEGEFFITFNDVDGNSWTITTPEGETIDFTEDDLEWEGEDPHLGGQEIARFTNATGVAFDVTAGGTYVTVPAEAAVPGVPAGCEANPPCDTDPVDAVEEETAEAYAVVRLDETDTRPGFETYAVVGLVMDADDLPRYAQDVIDDAGTVVHEAGTLVEGQATYDGTFVASMFMAGESVTDNIYGTSTVVLDFFQAQAMLTIDGRYQLDDLDDTDINGIAFDPGNLPTYVPGTPTTVGMYVPGTATTPGSYVPGTPTTVGSYVPGTATTPGSYVPGTATTPGSYVTGDGTYLPASLIPFRPVPTYTPGDGTFTPGTVGSDGVFTPGTLGSDGVFTPGTLGSDGVFTPGTLGSDGVFTPGTLGSDGTFTPGTLPSVTLVIADTGDTYELDLSTTVSAADFDVGTDYTGELDGTVEIPNHMGDLNPAPVDITGTFGGAVYGPSGEHTAGVFEANDACDVDCNGDSTDPFVEIVGGYGAELDDAGLPTEPVPTP